MTAGQWSALTTTGLSRDLFVFGANNTLDYLNKGSYDPVRKQVRFFGQSHYGDQRWHLFDESTNDWSNLPDPVWDTGGAGFPGFLGHGYHHNTIDSATGDDYYRQFGNNSINRFNRATGQWVRLPDHPGNQISGALQWHPGIGTQGGLVLLIQDTVGRWDRATNTWSTAATMAPQGTAPIGHYSPPTGQVICGGGSSLGTTFWKVGARGAPVSIAASPISMNMTDTVTACCPVSGDFLAIQSDSVAFKYSVATNTWSGLSLAGAPAFGAVNSGSKIIAIPIPAYGVIMFLFGSLPGVYLYKHK